MRAPTDLHPDDLAYRIGLRDIGTQSDNMRDAVDRGRQRPSGCCGERVGNALLTGAAVERIKARLAQGEKGRQLAREHGVSELAISRIKTQRAWRHVA